MKPQTSISTPVVHLLGPGKLKVHNGRLAYTTGQGTPMRLDVEHLQAITCYGEVGVTDEAFTVLFRHGDAAAGRLARRIRRQLVDDGSPSDDRLREAAARCGFALRHDDVDRWLADFHVMLARPHIAACLHRAAYGGFPGARLQVEAERPFAVRDGDRLLAGSIDRLVTIWDGDGPIAADILDFKTDAIASDDQRALSEKVRFYTPQLRAYCQAVKKMTGSSLPRISARMLLVGAGLVIPIPTGCAG